MALKAMALGITVGASLGTKYISTFDTAEKKVVRLGGALKQTNERFNAAKNVTLYKDKLEKLRAKQAALGRTSPRLERGIAALERKYKAAKREAKGYGFAVGDVVKHQQKLAVQSKKLTHSLDSLNKKQAASVRLTQQRTKAIGLLGGAYAATRVLSAGMDFEHDLQMFGNVGGLDDAAIKTVKNQLIDLSAQVNQEATTLLGGVDFLVGKGLKVNQATDAIGDIGKAATATQTAVNELSAASFSIIDNMGVASGNISGSLNVIAASGKMGGFELNKMAQYFPVLTAQAKMLGLEGNSGLATLGASLQIAMKGAGDESSAANNLQNFLAKITSKETVANLEKMGVSVRDVFDGAKADGLDPIVEIIKEIKRVTEGDAFALNNIFGDMQVKNFITPMLQNMDEFYKIRETSLAAGNVIDEDFDRMMMTSKEKWKRTVIGFSNIGQAFFTSIKPALQPVLEGFGTLSIWVSNAARQYPVIGQILGVMAVGFGLVTAGAIAYTAAIWLWNTATALAIRSTFAFGFSLLKTAALLVAKTATVLGSAIAMGTATAAQWLWNTSVVASSKTLLLNSLAIVRQKAMLIGSTIATKAITVAQGLWGLSVSASSKGLLFNTLAIIRQKAVLIGAAVVTKALAVEQWLLNASAFSTSRATTLGMLAIIRQKAVMLGAAVATKAVTAAQWLFNASLLANPIGLVVAGVVAGVAALAGAAYLIWDNWQPITQFFSDLFNGIIASVGEAFDWVVGKFTAIADFVGGLFGDEEKTLKTVVSTDNANTAETPKSPLLEPVVNKGNVVDFAPTEEAKQPLLDPVINRSNVVDFPPPDKPKQPLLEPVINRSNMVDFSPPEKPKQQPFNNASNTDKLGGFAIPEVQPVPAQMAAGSDVVTPMASPIKQTNNVTIQITQQAGEDVNALAERIITIMERNKSANYRGAMYD